MADEAACLASFTAKQCAYMLSADTAAAASVDKTYVTMDNATQIWILLSGFLVFWMHAGFSMLEAGSVRAKNTINILFKNIVTVCIGAIAYFFTGWAFSYGTDNADDASFKFIGSGGYVLDGQINSNKHNWFFQYAFAATAATIVSGAVAERTKLTAYFVVAFWLTALVYPVVAHWVWGGGWLTAGEGGAPFEDSEGSGACGMIDYAGSCVVHLVGGTAGLVGALLVGPREGRWAKLPTGELGDIQRMQGHNISLCAIGTFILWFGWFGFNCGSTLEFNGPIASKVAITTVLSPSAACLTGIFFHFFLHKTWDLGLALNCVLAGLVSITAGCSTVNDWHAIIIGIIGAFVYMGASFGMKKLKIDDPLDAVAVHGACGVWGCLAVGIFASSANIMDAYGAECDGNSSAWQFAAQLVGCIATILWTGANSALVFGVLKAFGALRVSEEEEEEGLDASEHGGMAYELSANFTGKSGALVEDASTGAEVEMPMTKV